MLILREETIVLQTELCPSLRIWSNGTTDLFKDQNLELAEWSQSIQRPSMWSYIDFCNATIQSTAEKDKELPRGVTHNNRSVLRPSAFPEEDTDVPEEHWLLLVQVPWHCFENTHNYTPYTPEKKCGKCVDQSCSKELVRHRSQRYFYHIDDRCWT